MSSLTRPRTRDVQAVETIIERRIGKTIRTAQVVALSKDGQTARVRLGGSVTLQSAQVLANNTVQAGDTAILLAVPEQGGHKWTVLGSYRPRSTSSNKAVPVTEGELAKPGGLVVMPANGYLVARWNHPPQRPDLTAEVEIANEDGTGDVAQYTVSGSLFLLPQNAGVIKAFRVRFVDSEWRRSAWTAWVNGAAGEAIRRGPEAQIPIPPVGEYYATDTKVLYLATGGRWEPVGGAGTGAVHGITLVEFTYQTPSPTPIKVVLPKEVINTVRVIIDVPFNGMVQLSVGEPGDPSRLMSASDNDPHEAGQYETSPSYQYAASDTVNLMLTKSDCTSGSGRLILISGVP